MLNVVCVKWGTKYGPEYVNILRDMVGRNLFVDYRFICFTDDPTGLNDGIEVRKLPNLLTGWWNKLYLFKQGVLTDRTIFFDLDTVITGRLEALAEYSGKFAILRDFYRPNGYGSGVMMWEPGYGAHIWDEFERRGFPDIPGGDQIFIEQCVNDADILQDKFPGAFCSYKVHAQNWPPDGVKVVCFHGEPRPHNCPSEWVPHVWKIGGMGEALLTSKCNTEIEQRARQIEINLKRGLPEVVRIPAIHGRQMVIVGGGPSLKNSLAQIRFRKSKKCEIWATNGTHDYLIERGIIPDYFAMCDAREENVRFVQKPHKDVTYFISSQCHPAVFDALEGYRVMIWHNYEPELKDTIIKNSNSREIWMIGGGGTVGLRLMYMGPGLGYRFIHLYGFDSCYSDDSHHAYPQALNDGERRITVYAQGKKFVCAPWMMKQAQDYQEQLRTLTECGCRVFAHGEGLIPFIHQQKHIGENYASIQ